MSEPARYQRAEQLARSGHITTSRGVDAVTGLPVLIYDFPGAPRLKPGQLDSDAVPAVLAAGFDGSNGVLVAAHPPGATQLADSGVSMSDDLVLQVLTALRDASRVGLVHGAITPERLLMSHDRVYVEGYGVPWNPGSLAEATKETIRAALTRDLVSTTKALMGFGSAGMSDEVAAALKGALGSATRAGDAGQLYTVVRRLAGGAVTVPPSGFGNLVIPTTDDRQPRSSQTALDQIGLDDLNLSDLELDELDLKPRQLQANVPDDETESWQPPGAGLTPTPIALFDEEPLTYEEHTPPAALTTPAFPDEPDPITLHSDPGPTLTVDPSLRDSGAGFVKDLPPGATYRAGNTEEAVRVPPMELDVSAVPKPRKRAWRLPILLLTLVLVAGASGYLALVARRDAPSALPGGTNISHVVNVLVDPPNLPPVSLVVEQRPATSAFRSGTIIASVPRQVRFDAAGVWVVHASFQGRVSESVTLRVPEDRSITIVFPPLEDQVAP